MAKKKKSENFSIAYNDGVIASDSIVSDIDNIFAEEKDVIVSRYDSLNIVRNGRHQLFVDCNAPNVLPAYRELFARFVSRSFSSRISARCAGLYPLSMLAKKVEKFHSNIVEGEEKNEGVKALYKLLIDHASKIESEISERIANGVIEWDDIQRVFFDGSNVYVKGVESYGGIIVDVSAQDSWTGRFWRVRMKILHTLHGNLEWSTMNINIGEFDGAVSMKDFPISFITDEQKAALMDRGKKVAEYTKPGSYVYCSGSITQCSWRNSRQYKAIGRAIMDAKSMEAINPEQWGNCEDDAGLSVQRQDSSDAITQINGDLDGKDYTQDELWLAQPYLYGFSMVSKRWGKFNLSDIHPIKFSDKAFDQLVMNENDKGLIHSLVAHHGQSFTDIVDGKGGGSIFLLHGEPGQGKTLTAEAVAELLHRPLYSISVGELGTDPKQLEESLSDILNVATAWNAVLLLDEADIFLEARDEKDILRNAMVGIFLRLLEYHQGVMFLTTNRVKRIDRAFYSRISLALSFEMADENKRCQIWTNLLAASSLSYISADHFVKFAVNGRQIKNVIRMAQTLARSEDRMVSLNHIKRCLERVMEFAANMSGFQE